MNSSMIRVVTKIYPFIASETLFHLWNVQTISVSRQVIFSRQVS